MTALETPPASTLQPVRTHPTNLAQQSWIMVKRNMIHTKRMPEMLSDVTAQPIMFVLLFAFVFGASITNTGGASYREFLLPGIQAQTIVFSAFVVAAGITADVEKGIIDRFRSLPISRSSVLIGRSIASVIHSSLGVVVMALTGLAIGWRIRNSAAEAVLAFGLLAVVRLRDDLVRHPHRFADAHRGGGQRRDVHRAVSGDVPGQHVRADRADAALATGDCGMEPGVVAGTGDARTVGQRRTGARERSTAASLSGTVHDPVVAGADGCLRAGGAVRLRRRTSG